MAGASAERIFEILDRLPDVADAPGAGPIQVTEGRVRFENVSFAYSREVMKSLSRSVLKEVSFEALPNQVVALLGPTGSGKTSIVNLIPRFYDPTAGRITIDGQDILQVTVASLRAQIGMVLQETTLFAASVRENITFGQPEATQEEVENAARMAQADEFIQRMPQGYDTEVGERGITLSGGQKQRLAIARALLTDPRILILDDATSSVDSRDRASDPDGTGKGDAEPHHLRHRPPPEHGPARRPDPGARPRQHRGARQARRIAQIFAPLPFDLRAAVETESG